jgi:replicative DNA helicase
MDFLIPPHSEEAEHATLGAIILDGRNTFFEVAEILQASDFYIPAHQKIFSTMLVLAEKNKPIDAITINELQGSSDQEEFVYLISIAKNTPCSTNAKMYANIVKEKAMLRYLINASTEIQQRAYEKSVDLADVIENAQQKIMSLSDLSSKREPRGMKDILTETIDYISQRFTAGSAITGLATGFTKLDELTGGLQDGELTIIAARPSMGKTTLAINIAENMQCRQDKPIIIFSMEMPSKQISLRMVSSIGKIEQNKIKTGKLNDIEFTKISSAVAKISEKNIIIDDSGALSSMELNSKVRKIAMKYGGVSAVFIDYLQLMRISNNAENRAVGVAEVSRSLKSLAMELNIPVVALSQLNRSLEQRGDKRPILSDLKDSGGIEQDADLIIFIYRDEVYNQENDNGNSNPKKAEIIIGKQRNGAIGSFNLNFLPEFSRFENFNNFYADKPIKNDYKLAKMAEFD